jgi:hypothetical protein
MTDGCSYSTRELDQLRLMHFFAEALHAAEVN